MRSVAEDKLLRWPNSLEYAWLGDDKQFYHDMLADIEMLSMVLKHADSCNVTFQKCRHPKVDGDGQLRWLVPVEAMIFALSAEAQQVPTTFYR